MEPYNKHRPTAFDHNVRIREQEEGEDDQNTWLVAPVSIHRDTESCLDLSNWRTFLDALAAADPDGDSYQVHRFAHWGHGWYKLILVKPETAAAEKAEKLENALASYPILDESDMSERETEEQERQWRDWGRYEFKQAIITHFEDTGSRPDEWPDGAFDLLAYKMSEVGLCEYPHHSGDDVRFECIDKADSVTRELAAWALRQNRKNEREERARKASTNEGKAA